MDVNELYSSYFLYFLISLQKEWMGEAENVFGLIFSLKVLHASTRSQYSDESIVPTILSR